MLSQTELTYTDWLEAYGEFNTKKQALMQFMPKEAFTKSQVMIEKVQKAILKANSGIALDEQALLILNADIIALTREIKTELLIFKSLDKFSLLTSFFQKVEEFCQIDIDFFEELPHEINKNIFENIDLNDPAQARQKLTTTNRKGFFIYNTPQIDRLLAAIVQRKEEVVKRILQKNLHLLLEEGSVTDYSGRTFYKAAPFKVAMWLKDVKYMCPLILDCLPQNEGGERLREELLKQSEEVISKGLMFKLGNKLSFDLLKPFDYAEFINALETYTENYDDWSEAERRKYWCETVGAAECNLPVHVIALFCGAGEYDYEGFRFIEEDTCPADLTVHNGGEKKEFWFTPADSKGLGESFAYTRLRYDNLCARSSDCPNPFEVQDVLKAIILLKKHNEENIEVLMSRLKTPIINQNLALNP